MRHSQSISSDMTRRGFLGALAASAVGLAAPRTHAASRSHRAEEVVLHIESGRLEIAPGRYVNTTIYSGALDGGVLRLPARVPVSMAIHNRTRDEEFVHWHGMSVPVAMDGTCEEGSLAVGPDDAMRYVLPVQEQGFCYVHSHAMTEHSLQGGPYSGQYLPVVIGDSDRVGGAVDQEVFLSSHEWFPQYVNRDGLDRIAEGMHHLRVDDESEEQEEGASGGGWEIEYKAATLNGKVLGADEPVRVKTGQRVLFHVLNASATEPLSLHLPGHRFHVVALDGSAVPRPAAVEVLCLGVGERASAVVMMDTPGIWILGAVDDEIRSKGLGVVVEYASATGKPLWSAPYQPAVVCDYRMFAESAAPSVHDTNLSFRLERRPVNHHGFEQWAMVAAPGNHENLRKDQRTRIHLQNATDEAHPMHLHRYGLELVNYCGDAISGVKKDTVVVPAYGSVAFDLTPTQNGSALFHCHNQMHMDCGLKTLLNVV
jgi:FtsP/CotA-like multicopper oxidase with cupredoxin domain